MAYSSTRQNLSVDVQGNNDGVKPGGAPLERSITVKNRGTVPANIDLWVRSIDAKSELLRWCTLFEANGAVEDRLSGEQGVSGLRLPQVEPQSTREVVLRFDVPPQAEPGFYSYDIVAQAPQYPGEQSRRTQQLRVLTSGLDVGLRSEPAWLVEPATGSETAYPLQAGTALQVKVTVTNRSDAVDRFYLSCPELDPHWFDPPFYPETSPDAPGFVARTDGLMLNPGDAGEILLQIHPPPHTPAGFYSSTLRLTSFNRTNLVLLDIIYLKIEVNDALLVSLHPPAQKIPSPIESFTLALSNPGNVVRAVGIAAGDRDEIFTYAFTPDRVQLAPGQSRTVVLTPKPRKWWRRTWRGQAQEIDFGVELFEAQEAAQALYLPDAIAGQILWQSRPAWILQALKWLRRLLIAALILLLLAGVARLAYWLLRKLVIEPSEQPRILEFATTEEAYQAGVGNPIRLDWKISNPQTEAEAIATYYASDGSVVLEQSYPLLELEDNPACETGSYQPNVMLRLIRPLYEKTPDIPTVSCIGIAPQPAEQNALLPAGEYQVRLVVVEAVPAAEPEPEAKPRRSLFQPIFRLFGLGNVGFLSSRSNAAQSDAARSPAARSFDSQKLTNIKLTPAPPLPLPEILYFYSKTPIYRQASAGRAPAGAGALPQYPGTPIQLNWVINHTREIEALELNSVHVAPNGAIASRQTRYAVQNGVPAGLGGQCRSQGTRLLCENVPTAAAAPGNYTFTLNVVMSQERGAAQITKDSEPIEIRPPLPDIQQFSVNGTDVLQNPQLVQMLNPARGPVRLNLNWQVADPDRVKVELLPAPGMVEASTQTLSYTLSPTPGSTTLTLQVTNQAGEVVSRSVVIQTATYPAPPAPLPVPPAAQPASGAASGAAGAAGSGSAPGAAVPGTPIEPGQLPPFELPPRAN